MTIILYLIGRSGTGKYTIAKEIAKSGYKIVDNQLVNNPIFSLLDLYSQDTIPLYAWDAITGIRNAVFQFLKIELTSNYVLTNELFNDDGDHALYHQVKTLAARRNSIFIPIKLLISPDENTKRIQNPERQLRYKSIRISEENLAKSLIKIAHPNLLELDVSNLSVKQATAKILTHIHQVMEENDEN